MERSAFLKKQGRILEGQDGPDLRNSADMPPPELTPVVAPDTRYKSALQLGESGTTVEDAEISSMRSKGSKLLRRSFRYGQIMSKLEDNFTTHPKLLRDMLIRVENPDWAGKGGHGSTRVAGVTLPTQMRSLERAGTIRPAFTKMLTHSFEKSNPKLGKWASQIFAYTFSPAGIFLIYRICPLLYYVTAPMVIFCPSSSALLAGSSVSICGDSTFTGLIAVNKYYVISILFVLFLAISVGYVIYQCSVYWIRFLNKLADSPLTRQLQMSLRATWSVSQNNSAAVLSSRSVDSSIASTSVTIGTALDSFLHQVPPELPQSVDPTDDPDESANIISLSAAFYYLFSPVFVCVSELVLLLRYPFRLSSSRFFGDYEIFRNFVFGSSMGLFAITIGVLGIIENFPTVSAVSVVLVTSASLMLLINLLFSQQFSCDDGSSWFAAFLSCHYIASHAPEMLLEESNQKEDIGDCPFYKTMRYRERVDFRSEGKLKDFQISQMVNLFKNHCQISDLDFAIENKVSQTASAIFCAALHNGFMDTVERINRIDVKELVYSNQLVMSPDLIRVINYFRPGGDSDLVPWNDEEVKWWDGIGWPQGKPVLASKGAVKTSAPPLFKPTRDTRDGFRASDYCAFTFTVSVALTLIDPFKLIEIDLGSNGLTDDVVQQLSKVVTKSANLVYLEIGGNKFSYSGMSVLVSSISGNRSIVFARLTTVLLPLKEIRESKVVDLSLPTLYADSVNRSVCALYDACCGSEAVDILRGELLGRPFVPSNDSVVEKYFDKIQSIISTDYRLVGRDFFRSIPPALVRPIVQRVARRLGRYVVEDPGEKLDLPGDLAISGNRLVTNMELLFDRLYMFVLDRVDLDLICELIGNQNETVEEIDLRGTPLRGELGLLVLKSLRGKKFLKSLNLNSCYINHPSAFEEVLGILMEDHKPMREMRLKGNPSFKGTSAQIWDLIGNTGRASHPDVVVDQGAPPTMKC